LTEDRTCVYCDYKWKVGDSKIHHIMEHHQDKIPTWILTELAIWYDEEEKKSVDKK